MYTVSYLETRKHHMLWINKVFCTWRPTCWWDVFCSALTGWGGHQRGCSCSYVWIMGKKVGIRLAAAVKCCVLCSQLLTEGSHNGETCLDKYAYFVHCSDVLWLFSKTPLFKTISWRPCNSWFQNLSQVCVQSCATWQRTAHTTIIL